MNEIKQVEQGQLLQAAIELTQALDRMADVHLPEKLAGIVKTHAGIAVGSAFIPIPGVDMIAAASNIWTMYVRINNELELPFAENLMRSLATGVVTNLGAAALGYMVIGSAFKLVPGLGSLGGAAILSATIYGVTIASGIVYMKAVSRLLINEKRGQEVNEENLKWAIEEIMDDDDSVHNILAAAKKDYAQLENSRELTSNNKAIWEKMDEGVAQRIFNADIASDSIADTASDRGVNDQSKAWDKFEQR